MILTSGLHLEGLQTIAYLLAIVLIPLVLAVAQHFFFLNMFIPKYYKVIMHKRGKVSELQVVAQDYRIRMSVLDSAAVR